MRRPLHNLFLLFLLVSAHTLTAQDIHLSHIHASPILLNPAMTGLFNGDLRLIANSRSQWQNVTQGYKTVVGSADGQLTSIGRNDIIGGGIQLYTDKAGDLDFTTRSVSVYGSILKSLDRQGTNFISIGIQNSLYSQSVNFSNISAFDDEPAILEGSPSQNSNWDVSAGIAWFYAIDKDNSFHMGGSIFHINQPESSFLVTEDNKDINKLYQKYVIHGGADLRLGKKTYLKPSFITSVQGPHSELTLGSFLKYKSFRSSPNSPGASIYFGTWVRWNLTNAFQSTDAIVTAVRMDLKETYITFSFDINVSTLSNVSKGHGGPELSVVQLLHYKRSKRKPTKVECPDF